MKKRVLIVDDSRMVRMMEEMLLSGEDVEIVTAADGREAVDKAVESKPDLILMDVVMPELDGLGACKTLRARPETSSVPIILVTSQGNLDQVEQGFASGCSDYITKPIDGNEFRAKVTGWLK